MRIAKCSDCGEVLWYDSQAKIGDPGVIELSLEKDERSALHVCKTVTGRSND